MLSNFRVLYSGCRKAPRGRSLLGQLAPCVERLRGLVMLLGKV